MPSVSNLWEKLGLQWLPDADAVNAPETALLRADNLVNDKIGALDLRRGSSILYSGLNTATSSVHSLHTVELANGTTYRATAADDKFYINGALQDTFTGSGDISIDDDSYQIFVARGTTKKKFDGTNWYNWGIPKPSGVPTLAAVASVTKSVAGFDNTESPATTIAEGGGSIGTEADAGGVANSASKLIPAGDTSRGVIQRLFTTDQDYFTISGVEGTETDLFDIYLKMEDPRNVETIKVVFGLDDSSTVPFTTDRFEFEFNLQSKKEIPIKDFESEAYGAYIASVTSSLGSVRPQDITGISTPEQIKNLLANVGKVPSPTTAPPSDPAVWGHLTCTRGQFKRIGSTAGRGWDTVRGFKIIYTTRRGTTSFATFADAIFVGGGARTLTGTFRCVVRAARAFSQYYELSPPSEPSDSINLNHQTLQVTIPGTLLSTLDPQVDQLWVYLFGGWLDAYYRFAVVSSTVRGGMTIDELKSPVGSDFDSADKRARITSWGFTMLQGGGSSDLVMTLDRSEMEALQENERLEPFQMRPPDNIVGIAGPWKKRMFVLTEEGYVYPSTQRDPGSFNSRQVIDLTRYGDPKWIVTTNQGVMVGMEKDIVLLAGSGDDSVDLAEIDLYAQPYNVGNPPVDACRWVDGNAVVYRSADGMMMFTGGSLNPVPMAGTSLLWRGVDRHGVGGLNTTTGRFRCAVDDAMLYVLAPEGAATTSSNVIWRYSTHNQQWSRLVYGQVTNWKSLFKEPDGTLIAGDDTGRLWQLDVGTSDNSQDIAINLLTPVSDGGNPLARKDALDLQIHGTTYGDTGTITLYKDGDLITAPVSFTFSSVNVGDVYRINASSFGTFLKAQIGITGTFNRLAVQNVNLTYRARPQHTMILDTGYIVPGEPADFTWLYEVVVDAIAYDDLILKVYVGDVLKHTISVPTTSGVRKPYLVPIPRGTKGARPRLVIYIDGSDGSGNVGFECYEVRVRMASTGNQDAAQYRTVYPVGNAP